MGYKPWEYDRLTARQLMDVVAAWAMTRGIDPTQRRPSPREKAQMADELWRRLEARRND